MKVMCFQEFFQKLFSVKNALKLSGAVLSNFIINDVKNDNVCDLDSVLTISKAIGVRRTSYCQIKCHYKC